MINTNTFSVAIYIRLSKEDLNKKDSLKESYSVQNQRLFLENYIKKQNYRLFDIYIDDGYTGTNFNRPAFKRMMNDISVGKVNMVITKDLSRLGRDYIETGEYIEKIFPLNKVRYVAVLDGIDTFMSTSNNDITPFKAIINDMYSRDNSKKIKTALISLKKAGKWIGSCPPLGYKKDSLDKNHLIINEKESYIIKTIFNYALKGLNCYQIKEKLIQDHIPTMSVVRNKESSFAKQGIWSAKTVNNILKNQVYIGNLVQNKCSRVSYKIRKLIKNKLTDWIIVPNTHEAIIDKDIFEDVQNLLKNRQIKSTKTVNKLLDGLLFCYECNHKIGICSPRKKDNKIYTICNTYKMYSKHKLCTPHSNNYECLEAEILKSLKSVVKFDCDFLFKRFKKIYIKKINLNENYLKIADINKLIELKNRDLDKMYIDKLELNISDDMYKRIKLKIEEEIKTYSNRKKLLINQLKLRDSNKLFEELRESFLKFNKIFLLRIVKKIVIHQDKQIDIYFNFKKSS